MAVMIPENISSDTESMAEVKTFKYFQKAFDDSWTIFHSFSMQGENKEKKLIDAEADFVLFNKDYGLLVLEVKGGIINFDGAGNCFQNGYKIKDPEFQAKMNIHDLNKILIRRLHGDPQLKLAHAIYFPDTYVDVGKLPPQFDSNLTFTGNETPYIVGCIEKLFNKKKSSRKYEISDRLAKAILNALSPKISIGNSILDKIGQGKSTFKILTEVQCQLLKFISGYKHALIEGYAGSGKTILAIKKARQLALEGNKVLLLCYNKMLAEYLKESVKDLNDIIYARTYHDFCIDCLEKSRFKEKIDFNAKGFWEIVIPDLMQQYIAEYPLDYDAVIIDEAQDFKEDYWLSLLEQVSEDKYFYLFYDPSQNIFTTKMSFPEETIPFTLKRICRNTVSIFEFMQKYTESDIEIFDDVPIGDPVQEYISCSGKESLNHLENILKDLIHKQDINPDSIIVLGGHNFKHTILKDKNKFQDIVVLNPEDYADKYGDGSNEKRVRYCTYMKFKGCDADIVILLDVDEDDSRWNNSGIYTAASRAKNLLYVIKKTY